MYIFSMDIAKPFLYLPSNIFVLRTFRRRNRASERENLISYLLSVPCNEIVPFPTILENLFLQASYRKFSSGRFITTIVKFGDIVVIG